MTNEKELKEVRANGGVEIMKASAGSGKTFALAREYIRLLLLSHEPNAHRHILAVTFTNKATAEMKSRIIAELSKLSASPRDSDYFKYLCDECKFESDAALSKAADKALRSILNDYGAFSVSTIDKFFQQTLRAFSREVGQFDQYQIELDKSSLISESVDRVLDSLSDSGSELLQWFSKYSIKGMEDGGGYHLDGKVEDFAKNYMSDAYTTRAREESVREQQAYSKENLEMIYNSCCDIARAFDKDFSGAVKSAFQLLDSFPDGSVNSYLYKYVSGLRLLKPGDEIKFNTSGYWAKSLEDGSNAFTKDGRKKLSQSDFDAVRDAIGRIDFFRGRPYRARHTAEMIKGEISMFRVGESLTREFSALLKEKNVLSLDDTNAILRDIIAGTETPFIYEKMGVRYNHFLLDEFQDTSVLQWENFLPLLRNSIAEGCYNLVVGDVKQSIYRWRNADWNILGKRVGTELNRPVFNPLEQNWRSAPNIVEFNNGLFDELSKQMDRQLGTLTNTESTTLTSIYSDVAQTAARSEGPDGCVDITFCNPDSLLEQSVSAVQDALDKGFSHKDIAVIVRTNALGGEVAAALINAGIPVVSNDSLLVSSSSSVRTLVSTLFKVDNPDDDVNGYYALDFQPDAFDSAHSIVEMAELVLKMMPREKVNEDTLYVLAFMDLLRDFVSRNGNSLHAFLNFWQQEGMNKTISSPEGSDAVTIITVHKAKGLDYPFVVVPLPRKTVFVSGKETSWECPDLSGTPLQDAEKMIFHVGLKSDLANTLFDGNYARALPQMYTDNINVWYVAFTRASQAMHIVVPLKDCPAPAQGTWPDFSDMSKALYFYASQHLEEELDPDFKRFSFGTPAPKWVPKSGKEKKAPAVMPLECLPDGVSQNPRGTLRVRSDANEFFSPDGAASGFDSKRVRGIVLHGILERVCEPSDLEPSIERSRREGLLPAECEADVRRLLSSAMASVQQYGWFEPRRSRLLDERDLVDALGEVHRPDRVVLRPDGSVDIVDYKFAEPLKSHVRQVRGYIDLYHALGYKEVNGYLWYVEQQNVVKV